MALYYKYHGEHVTNIYRIHEPKLGQALLFIFHRDKLKSEFNNFLWLHSPLLIEPGF